MVMPINGNGHTPDLAQLAAQANKRFGAQLAAMPVRLSDQGLVEGAVGSLTRSAYMDATQLLAEIRQIVKEEVRSLRNEIHAEMTVDPVRKSD